MDTSVFSWRHCEKADENEMSACIDMWECADSPFVAYYIPNKLDIMGDYTYSGVYKPLENNFGIYFLMGKNDKGEKSVYIGQASERDTNKGMARLREHVDPKTREWYYDKWQSAVFITSKSNDWHSGLLNDIEAWLINRYEEHGGYIKLNSRNGEKGNSEKSDMARKVLAIIALVSKPKFGYSLGNVTIEIDEDKLAQAGLVAVKVEELEGYRQAQNELNKLKSNRTAEQIRLDNYRNYADWEEKFEKIDIPIYNGRIEEKGKEPRYQDVVTPTVTSAKMVDTLPAELFNSKTTFIDIYTKSASILIAIIKRLMSDDPALPINSESEFIDRITRINHIIEHQIFGVAGTEKGYINSVRVIKDYTEGIYKEVYGEKYRDFRYCNVILPNIFRIKNYSNLVKHDKAYAMKEIGLKVSGGTREDMKFDVVCGNPPYNNDLYIPFVEMGNALSKEYSLWITPAKWQAKGGEANKRFRQNIVPYMNEIVYYPDCLDIFAIQESSGISYYTIGKNKVDKCKVTNSSAMKSIINSTEIRSISEEQTLWNIGNKIVNQIYSIENKRYNFNSIAYNKEYTVNLNTQLTKATGTSGCWDWKKSCIKPEWVGKGGVLFTKNGTIILPNPKIITKDFDYSSNTSVNVFTSDNINECKSFISWVQTKFIRFLLLINIGSLTMMNERGWRFVPDPGAFDHIFTDEELYKRYNLTEEEINIIEAIIKARETIKENKLYIGTRIDTGTKVLDYWVGNEVSDTEVTKLQGILITTKDATGKNIITSIHLDTKQFESCNFEILISNGQSTWQINSDINSGFQVNKSFSTITETAENNYPLLNSYKDRILDRISYVDGVLDIR